MLFFVIWVKTNTKPLRPPDLAKPRPQKLTAIIALFPNNMAAVVWGDLGSFWKLPLETKKIVHVIIYENQKYF